MARSYRARLLPRWSIWLCSAAAVEKAWPLVPGSWAEVCEQGAERSCKGWTKSRPQADVRKSTYSGALTATRYVCALQRKDRVVIGRYAGDLQDPVRRALENEEAIFVSAYEATHSE